MGSSLLCFLRLVLLQKIVSVAQAFLDHLNFLKRQPFAKFQFFDLFLVQHVSHHFFQVDQTVKDERHVQLLFYLFLESVNVLAFLPLPRNVDHLD